MEFFLATLQPWIPWGVELLRQVSIKVPFGMPLLVMKRVVTSLASQKSSSHGGSGGLKM